MRVETKLTFIQKENIGAEGRNSDVFIAEDIQLGTDIVVKTIKKKDLDRLRISDYFAESKILYASQHPNIVELNYSCENDDYIFLSMPLYKKGSINSLINKRFLSVREIITYSLEFLSGLHFVHSRGLLHFDIKPTNILISDSNTALLTDFGLAKYTDVNGFATPDQLYPPHMAPERFSVDKFDIFFDIYHCGLTLYRMCNGNEEFINQRDVATTDDIENGTFPNRNKFLPHIPKSLQNVIKKALSVNPVDRYNTVLEMLNDLSKIDKNLDWLYTQDNQTRTFVWKINEDKTVKYITVSEMKGKWSIAGKQYSKSSNKTSKITKWDSDGYKSLEEAFKKAAKLIYDYENTKK
ncbi:protein kinase [Paenibacillus sp. LMG 31458]|uniref:Protein kinase n=1 Tax=Paenibacillus phytorum TaxID=2654977 RepID=A0ABX1XXF9_9BACL|nr:serine/threonine-protein kinase [Paenibacillus phytorum]NOU72530.1 protein kinase [Paenibacillus phytorum]